VTEHELDDFVLVAGFRSALRRFLRRSETVARKHGLTPQRYQLLVMVKGAPDRSERASVGDLAQRLHLAQSTVTELIGRAEAAGLLQRETSARDARLVYLRLTAEGEERLRRTMEDLQEDREALADALLRYRRSR
jgi:DNA-binding MarR family transcriptional regulator